MYVLNFCLFRCSSKVSSARCQTGSSCFPEGGNSSVMGCETPGDWLGSLSADNLLVVWTFFSPAEPGEPILLLQDLKLCHQSGLHWSGSGLTWRIWWSLNLFSPEESEVEKRLHLQDHLKLFMSDESDLFYLHLSLTGGSTRIKVYKTEPSEEP